MKKEDLTIVIPTLNEEEGIGLVLDEIFKLGYPNVLVVDGYSKDRTVEIAREKGAQVVMQEGVGKSGAIKTAINMVKTPYILVMDGDFTYDPKDIEKILAYAPNYDEVIGIRSKRNIPWLHRIGNRIISTSFSLLLGQRLSDVCSGMYLLRTECARALELSGSGFDIEVEIAGQICSYGRVAEVPINYRARRGKAKLRTWRAGIEIMGAVLKVMWLYNPVFIFSAIASLSGLLGLAIFLWQLIERALYGSQSWSIGWSLIGFMLLIVGLHGFTISTISLLLKRIERRIIQSMRK